MTCAAIPTRSQRHQRNRRSAGATTATNIGTCGHHRGSSSQNRLAPRTRRGSVFRRRRLVECLRWIRRAPRRPADRCTRVVTNRTSSHVKVSGALVTPRTSASSLASFMVRQPRPSRHRSVPGVLFYTRTGLAIRANALLYCENSPNGRELIPGWVASDRHRRGGGPERSRHPQRSRTQRRRARPRRGCAVSYGPVLDATVTAKQLAVPEPTWSKLSTARSAVC